MFKSNPKMVAENPEQVFLFQNIKAITMAQRPISNRSGEIWNFLRKLVE
jgi:hypothetical protein